MGDIITIVMEVKGVNFKEAMKIIHDILKIPFTLNYRPKNEYNPLGVFEKVKLGNKRSEYDFKLYTDDILKQPSYTTMPHISLIREAICPRVQNKYSITYCGKQSRVLFPHRHWSSGEIVGIFGRTTVDIYDILGIPKYFGVIPYPKSMNLYGLYENYEEIQKAGYVVIFESEKSVLKLDTMGEPVGVALGGHELSQEQIKILIGLNVDIIIALDRDMKEDVSIRMCSEFKGIRSISYINDKYEITGEKDAPVDKGIKTWHYLFKNKVKVG